VARLSADLEQALPFITCLEKAQATSADIGWNLFLADGTLVRPKPV
jgi:hypothetical protein